MRGEADAENQVWGTDSVPGQIWTVMSGIRRDRAEHDDMRPGKPLRQRGGPRKATRSAQWPTHTTEPRFHRGSQELNRRAPGNVWDTCAPPLFSTVWRTPRWQRLRLGASQKWEDGRAEHRQGSPWCHLSPCSAESWPRVDSARVGTEDVHRPGGAVPEQLEAGGKARWQ